MNAKEKLISLVEENNLLIDKGHLHNGYVKMETYMHNNRGLCARYVTKTNEYTHAVFDKNTVDILKARIEDMRYWSEKWEIEEKNNLAEKNVLDKIELTLTQEEYKIFLAYIDKCRDF